MYGVKVYLFSLQTPHLVVLFAFALTLIVDKIAKTSLTIVGEQKRSCACVVCRLYLETRTT